MTFALPLKFDKEYAQIKLEFSKVKYDWKDYNDGIIPEDSHFAKRIILFLIDIIDYVLNHYSQVDVDGYKNFLYQFPNHFYYGPNGDDNNYLDLDETIDGEPITEFFLEFNIENKSLSKNELVRIKKRFEQVYSMI